MPTSRAYVVTSLDGRIDVGLGVVDHAHQPVHRVGEPGAVADALDAQAVVAGGQRGDLGVVDLVGVAAHHDRRADDAGRWRRSVTATCIVRLARVGQRPHDERLARRQQLVGLQPHALDGPEPGRAAGR